MCSQFESSKLKCQGAVCDMLGLLRLPSSPSKLLFDLYEIWTTQGASRRTDRSPRPVVAVHERGTGEARQRVSWGDVDARYDPVHMSFIDIYPDDQKCWLHTPSARHVRK